MTAPSHPVGGALTFDQWWLSLPEGRRVVLSEDKLMFAEAAYNAGISLAAPVAPEPATLPHDVTIGGNTFRKGVALSTFISAAQGWHRVAYPDGYDLTDEQKAENLRRLMDAANPPASQPAEAVSEAMVQAYLDAQRAAVEEADRFGRPNVGGLHTNTVREACRAGITAALALAGTQAAAEPTWQRPRWQLERWGAGGNPKLLLERMDDGYWTPWHIAQAAVDIAAANPSEAAAVEPAEVVTKECILKDDCICVLQKRGVLRDCCSNLRAAAAVEPAAQSETVNAIIRSVAELPDRDSPPDWPEAMLVTADELRDILISHGRDDPYDLGRLHEAALAAQPPAPQAKPCTACTGRGEIGGVMQDGSYETLDCSYCQGTGNEPPAPQAAPAGWKLVPIEPTTEMMEADWNVTMSDAHTEGGVGRCAWAAMLAASPDFPATPGALTSEAE